MIAVKRAIFSEVIARPVKVIAPKDQAIALIKRIRIQCDFRIGFLGSIAPSRSGVVVVMLMIAFVPWSLPVGDGEGSADGGGSEECRPGRGAADDPGGEPEDNGSDFVVGEVLEDEAATPSAADAEEETCNAPYNTATKGTNENNGEVITPITG